MFVPKPSHSVVGNVDVLNLVATEISTPSCEAVPTSTKADSLPSVDSEGPTTGAESVSSGDGSATSGSHKESICLSTSSWQPEGEIPGHDHMLKDPGHSSIVSKASSNWGEEKENVWFGTVIFVRVMLILHTAERLLEDLTTTLYHWEAKPSVDRSYSR